MGLQSPDPQFLMRTLTPLLADDTRLVRVEAARTLARFPEREFRGQERKDLLAAIDEAYAATEVDNDRAGGHLIRGVLLENLQQESEAEQAYRTALVVEPEAVGPRGNLAALLDRRLEDTLARARQLVQSGNAPAARELLSMAGPLEDESFRLREEELGLLERDGLLVPDNAGLHTRLGLLRYLQGWHKEAERGLRVAQRLQPRTPDYAYNLAVFYRDTGRPREALALIQQLRQLRPQDEQFVQMEEEVRQRLRAGPSPGP
jgi:tetratricopeptide (TPR) repeat protein